ncbi:MAG: SH3 domain-containing protein [Christensenellales bacterium]|jgi:uncharacterized protein YraI
MKKIVSLMTLLTLLLGMLPASASIYDPNAGNMFIKTENGKSVNMREEPNTNAKIITTIPYGRTVLVYSGFISSQWAHVQYGMFNGYVMKKFLTSNKPRPFVSPTPKPTPIPTATPSPEQRRANEIKEAQKLGIVPQDMKTDGIATWDNLNSLLTNVVRLKTKSSAAQRTHVYLTKEEYEASGAGTQYNMVLRGVAAAEMYGVLLDIDDNKHSLDYVNDPFIADYADIQLVQQYAGRIAPYNPNDWRTMDLGEMVLIVMDHTDMRTGENVLGLDAEHNFYPTHPLTNEDAILAAYRLYNSCTNYVGTVVVTHTRQANLRKGPSMKNAIVGKADPGASYQVVAVEKGWYKVLLPDGKTAYISGSMVAFYQ